MILGWESHLLREAAGLAFVNGAGQWDIWQPLLGVLEVTCLELKMLDSTICENASKLVTAIAANISQLIAFQSNENDLPTIVIID